MSWEGLRGYAQAANDLSGIARARLLEVVREAVKGEIERAGGALGLAGVQEVARLRRTVERLERRVSALEEATGTGSPSRRPQPRPSRARVRTPAARAPVTPPAPPEGMATATTAPPAAAAAAPVRTPVRRPRPAAAARPATDEASPS